MTIIDVKVGDTIELDCPNLLHNTRSKTTIQGKVEAVFDALTKTGESGALEIDIIYQGNKWLRWIPHKDGGTLTIISRRSK